MKQLTLTVDDAILASAELKASRTGKPLARLLGDWLRQFSAAGESEFSRLAQEEEALRERMGRDGRSFSAGDRLTRESLHDRHALR